MRDKEREREYYRENIILHEKESQREWERQRQGKGERNKLDHDTTQEGE